jgi:predicted small lipoprotein YifL
MRTKQMTNTSTGRAALQFVPLTVLFGLLLNACGFRGPLYLPEDETAAQSATTQSAIPSTQADQDQVDQEGPDEAEDDDES